ncbi:MAG: FliM/FliN family flagellar motor switch protein [Acidimicrobiia bacterium]|nr:FliM/FliN family flagellar motor switch protein [Acidimicrobiia bacterium]MDH4309612.1 FliM/FliN family flagellar motor switch protein [Acidimicrobiia bacterium]MDH5292184.1 FliM/FliN family flagellar motor switch protein [Acidimicrobiia bacterium]
MAGPGPSTSSTDSFTPFDFRAPNKFQSGFVREFGDLHETFSRVLSDLFTRELKTSVTIESLGAEQLSYDAYVRSMPNPSVLSIVELNPLPGLVVVELSAQLGLVLVDRMLGGPGRPVAPRRPTGLEQTLLGALLEHPLTAIAETMHGVVDIQPRFVTSELNPMFAHAASPTEGVLVLTFSLVVDSSGPSSRGLISVCYPMTVLNPIREAMRSARWSGGERGVEGDRPMASLLERTEVELVARTRTTKMAAADLIGIQPGDVVMLDHGVADPLLGMVDGNHFMNLRLGRQGFDLAARLEHWT